MRQVFISYSHTDSQLAQTLSTYLQKKGIRVFLDAWRIGVGERISEVLSDALSASNYVILLASQKALASSWVSAEIDAAIGNEMAGKCRLLIVRVGDANLPALLRGKMYLELKENWDKQALEAIYRATQPTIFRNGWTCNVVDFAGNGGAGIHNLQEAGFPFYRLTFNLDAVGSYAGVFWEIRRGSINASKFTHFLCMLRGIQNGNGKFQLKFETKAGWPLIRLPMPSTDWREIQPIELRSLGSADWERLERITIAVDDRDIKLKKDCIFDVAGFYFF